MTIKVLLLPLLTQPLLVFFLCISHSSQSFFHTLSTLLKIRSDPSMQIFWVSVTVSLSDTFLMFLPSTSLLYQLYQQLQGSLRFSSATFSLFLVLICLCTCFSFWFPSVWCFYLIPQFAGGIQQIFNNDVWSVCCYEFYQYWLACPT